MQALAKDLPWKLKESRVLEILQAVSLSFKIHSLEFPILQKKEVKQAFSFGIGRNLILNLALSVIHYFSIFPISNLATTLNISTYIIVHSGICLLEADG